MRNTTNMGAVSLITLAAFVSGCAPVPPRAAPQAPVANTYNTAASTPAANYNANTYANNTATYDPNAYDPNAYATNTGGYDYSAAPPAYDYGSNNYNDPYAANNTNPPPGNYYAGNDNSSYGASGNYSSSYNNSGSNYGSSSYSSGGSSGNAGGSYAVQVLASPNRATAENMVSQMQASGFTATIDQVGGYYKVRVPYSTESEARASLGQIRSYAPDAFYTVR